MKKYHLSEFNSEATSLTRPSPKSLQHVPCKFFRQGTCTSGKNCIFSHDLELATEKTICKYFQKGNCKFGSKCALEHVLPDGRKVKTRAFAPSTTAMGSSSQNISAAPMANIISNNDKILPMTTMASATASEEKNRIKDEALVIKKEESNVAIPSEVTVAANAFSASTEDVYSIVGDSLSKKASVKDFSDVTGIETIPAYVEATNGSSTVRSPHAKRSLSSISVKSSTSPFSGSKFLSSSSYPHTPEAHLNSNHISPASFGSGIRTRNIFNPESMSLGLKPPILNRSYSASMAPGFSMNTFTATGNLGRPTKSPSVPTSVGSNKSRKFPGINGSTLTATPSSLENLYPLSSRRSVPNLISSLGTSPSTFSSQFLKSTDRTHSFTSKLQSFNPVGTSLLASSLGTSQEDSVNYDIPDEFANEEDFIPNSLQELLTPEELERKMSHGDEAVSSSSASRFMSKVSSNLNSGNPTPYNSYNGTPTSSRFVAFFDRHRQESEKATPPSLNKVSQEPLTATTPKNLGNLTAISETLENGQTLKSNMASSIEKSKTSTEVVASYDTTLDEETQFQMDEA